MFDTILLPLDGSRHAEAAIPYAVDQARCRGARLVLLHVVPCPEPCNCTVERSGPAPQGPCWLADELAEAEREAMSYLTGVVDRFGLPPETHLRATVGEPVKQLPVEATRHRRPLVVMTTGEAHTDARPPLSEVTRHLMVAGTVPVLGVWQLPSASAAA